MKVLWLLCTLALTAAQEDSHHHEEELRINGVEDVAHPKSEEIPVEKEESPVTSGLRTLLDNSPFFARIFKLVTGDGEDASPGRTFFGQDGQVPGNLLQMFFNNPLVQSNPILGGLLNAFVPSQASGRLLQAAAEGANAVAPAAPDVLGLLGLGGGGGGGGLAGIDGILGALFDLFGQNPLLGDLFTQTTGYNVQTLLGNKITLVREVFCVFFTSEAVSGDLVLSQLFAPFLQLFGVFFGESCNTQEAPVTEAVPVVPVVPVSPPVVKPVVFKRPQVIIKRVPYPVYRPYPVYYTRPVVYRPRPYRYYVRYGGPRRYGHRYGYGHRRYGSYGGHRRRYNKNKINKKW